MRGYRIRIVTSDAFAREKLDQMVAYGAELTLVPSLGAKVVTLAADSGLKYLNTDVYGRS